MSINQEDSDGTTRVRRSLRRMASNESLNEIESRASPLPTMVLSLKKLQTISEDVSTPTKRGRVGIVDSPIARRTRKGSEEPAGSPFRRTTRGMSQDKEISASPLPTRTSRRSALAESDDEVLVATPSKIKPSARNTRKSTMASPSIDQIVEESEDDHDENEQIEKKADESLNTTDELELRTRSIIKSPVVNSPSKKSLNGSASETVNGSACDLETSEEHQESNQKSFNTLIKSIVGAEDEANEKSLMNFSNNDLPELEKSASKNSRKSMQPSAAFNEIADRLVNSCSKPKPSPKAFSKVASPSDDLSSHYNSTDDTVLMIDEDVTMSPSHTPVRARRSIHGEKTPKSGTPKTDNVMSVVSKLMEDFVATDGSDAEKYQNSPRKTEKTPKKSPSKKSLLPLLADQTISVDTDMLLSQKKDKLNLSDREPSDMEMTLSTEHNKRQLKSPRVTSERKSLSLSQSLIEMEGSINETSNEQSLASYLQEVSSAAKSKRKSLSTNGFIEEDVVAQKPRAAANMSWSFSASKSADVSIDNSKAPQQPEIIKARKSEPALRRKRISSDESESEVSKNPFVDDLSSHYNCFPFVDDEAEVGSEDESMDESERNYMIQNEIPEDGESIGSQDSNELASDEEEDDDDSFIDRDEVSNSYSMDSAEEAVEELPTKQKRLSRIIMQSSSSEDEEAALEKLPQKSPKILSKTPQKSPKKVNGSESLMSPSKTPQKSPKKQEEEASDEEEMAVPAEVEKPNLKRKREHRIDANESIVVKTKRAKISVDEEKENGNMTGVADLFDEESSNEEDDSEAEPMPEQKPKKVFKKPAEGRDVASVLSKCNEIMGAYNESKRANLALKCSKKAAKLAMRKQEEASKPSGETLDSSNGSNKENTTLIKKKKKNKAKKQKLVEDMPDKKEEFAESVSKAQEKAEVKRQRKLNKKLAKLQREQENGIKNDQEIASAESVSEEKIKHAEPAQLTETQSEPMLKKQKSKANKAIEPEEVQEEIVEEHEKKKKNKKVTELEELQPKVDEASKIKKKKNKSVLEPEEVQPEVAEVSKKKKKKSAFEPKVVDSDVVGKKKHKKREVEAVEESVQVNEKKKSKKRKMEDSLEDEVVKPTKKLNILMQIEDPRQLQAQKRDEVKKHTSTEFTMPALQSQKLKNLIPQEVQVEKKAKKKSGKNKKIPEPRRSLPRPVWTSCGVFVEEPVTPPFKFTQTEYVPIDAGASSSTKFGVISFEAKKQKKKPAAPTAPVDFKTQAMMRHMNKRDGSMKNVRGLLGARTTF